jgi:hypothetical protein
LDKTIEGNTGIKGFVNRLVNLWNV